MDGPGKLGPGFAPAAGERGTVIWQGVAVCFSTLAVLAMPLTSAALIVALALDSEAAAGPDPVINEANPSGLCTAGTEAVAARATGAEALRPSDGQDTTPAGHGTRTNTTAPLPDTAGKILSRDRADEFPGAAGTGWCIADGS